MSASDPGCGCGDNKPKDADTEACEKTETEAPPEQVEACGETEDAPTGDGSGDPCTDSTMDPQEKYRQLCRRTAECKEYFKKLEECNERVNSKSKTEEKCVEEVIDYFHCVDHCAAKRFFKLLK